MIVVDTHIIANMVFPGEHTAVVIKLHEADPEWEVPVHWKNEFLKVVSLYLRKNYINYTEALDAIDVGHLLIGDREHLISPFAAMEFIQNSSCSSYDCEFVALADRLNVRLVTCNEHVCKAFPEIAVKPEDYIAQLIEE